MQKPRPKEAPAPRQQRLSRENRGSHEGASAPSSVSKGEAAPNQPQNPTSSVSEAAAKTAGTEPAVIVFGYNERRLPQAAWFTEAEADLATRAARLMGMRVLRIENDAHRELAAQLR